MKFDLNKSIELLAQTPVVLHNLLANLSDDWIYTNEGENTWAPFDIIGHLIYGEKTDWVPRMEVILSDQANKTFEPFDRFAQFRESKGKSLHDLLEEFTTLRAQNIQKLQSIHFTDEDWQKEGTHPALGQATLAQLFAAWVVHDLNHIAQIARVMAKQYDAEVGPWKEYLGILN